MSKEANAEQTQPGLYRSPCARLCSGTDHPKQQLLVAVCPHFRGPKPPIQGECTHCHIVLKAALSAQLHQHQQQQESPEPGI